MKKTLLLMISFLITNHVHALSEEKLHFIAQILQEGESIEIIQDGKRFSWPLEINKKNQILIKKLHPGEDVIINGHLHYRHDPNMDNGSFQTVFVVDTIQSISLQELGSIPSYKDSEKSYPLSKVEYSPVPFPLKSEAVVALTLTVGAVLLSTLAPPSVGSQFTNQLNSAILLGAGMLMTGAILYDRHQISQPKENL